MLIPFTYYFMLFMLKYNKNCKKQKNTQKLRTLSFLIYLTHEYIHFIYIKLSQVIHFNPIFENSLIKYIIIVSATIVISNLIITLSNKEKFKFLKKLY